MIDAYVINLDRQIENYSKVENAMNDLGGFNVQRVSAIDGKRGDHLSLVDSETTWLCKETCPDSVIAIALSHKKVAQMILDSGVDYALVLEDDAFPIKDGFHEKLQRTLAEVPDDWDIINLHYVGLYRNGIESGYFLGSAAAILVSQSGAQKIINLKIRTHIDLQTNFGFKKYKSREKLFVTDENNSTNRSNTTTLSAKIKNYMYGGDEIGLTYNYIKLFGFTWIADDLLNFLIYLIGFLFILFFKL